MIFSSATFSPKDLRDYKATTTQTDFPARFNIDTVPVKDQGNVNSCVAFALSELVEYYNRDQEKTFARMSTAYIYGNRMYEDANNKLAHGYYARLGLKVLQNMGVPYYKDFPGNFEMPQAEKIFNSRPKNLDKEAYKNRISTYFRLTKQEDIKACLMTGTPVICSIHWDNDTTVDEAHILHFKNRKCSTGHCVLIVGWDDDKGWLIQNSWGKNWGDNGFAYAAYNSPIREFWGTTDEVINGLEIKKPCWLIKFIYKILKFFKKKA